MAERSLAAKKREISTKGAVNALRREGNVPGVLYAKGIDPIAFYVSENAINPLVFTKENYIVNFELEGEVSHKAVIKDVQFDPVSDRIRHFDLHGLTAGHLIQMEVPVNFVGQAAGVKAGGNIQYHMHKLSVECLPANIPSHLDIDVTDLNAGQALYARDLNFEGIKVITPGTLMLVSVARGRGEAGE